MEKIVLVRKGKTRKRIEIILESGPILNLDREVVVTANLKPGQSISEDLIGKLSEEDNYKICYDSALHFLGYRQRSEAELKNHLSFKRGFNEDVVKRVTDKLKELKLLDDEAFAKQWKNDRIKFKPKSRMLIQHELIQKGVDAHTIQSVTQAIDDEANAYAAGRKKAEQLRTLDYKEFYRRLSGYLGRRGYSSDVVYSAIARLWKPENPKLRE